MNYAAIDWAKTWTTVKAMVSHAGKLRRTEGKPYQTLLDEVRDCPPTERSEPLQKLLDNDRAMENILLLLRGAANLYMNSYVTHTTLMTWQARWVLVKVQAMQMRHGSYHYDIPVVLKEDTDFTARLDAVLAWLKVGIVTETTDFNTFLPGMRFGPKVYEMSGPAPSLSIIGKPLSDAELQSHEAAVLQDNTIAENSERDHRVRCAICFSPYAVDDPAFQLTCGHVVGHTCMTVWFNTARARTVVCPHCNQVLCEQPRRVLVSPTPEQIARAEVLRARRNEVLHTAAQILTLVYKAHGFQKTLDEAQKLKDEVDAKFRQRGIPFSLKIEDSQTARGFAVTLERKE